MRRAASETSLQQPPATSVPTIKPSYSCPPRASLLATRRIALLRTQPNPHSRVRSPSAHHRPRVRSLAAFGRRPPCTWLRRSRPASETLQEETSTRVGLVAVGQQSISLRGYLPNEDQPSPSPGWVGLGTHIKFHGVKTVPTAQYILFATPCGLKPGRTEKNARFVGKNYL
jgi:hypothetical protein